jgi:hypothetical protein
MVDLLFSFLSLTLPFYRDSKTSQYVDLPNQGRILDQDPP